MTIGTNIVTYTDLPAVLERVEHRSKTVFVYNFEVEDFHTYFVGKEGLWVHNTCALRPFAKNLNLNKGLIEQMYRGSWVGGIWKSSDKYLGGLAGAIRREKATGELVGEVSHIPKGEERLKQLKNILTTGKYGADVLDDPDIAIVARLHNDLLLALQGK